MKKQMTESEIRQALAESSQHTASGMMRYMRNIHKGRYDKNLAQKNAKEMAQEISKY